MPRTSASDSEGPKAPGSIVVSDYALLVLDVLGQSSRLTRYKTAGDLEEDHRTEAQQLIDETVSRIIMLRDALSVANEHVNAPRPVPRRSKLSKEQEKSFQSSLPRSFEVYCVADSVVVYHPLVDGADNFSFGALLGLLLQCVGVMLLYGTKMPLRGAIECGWGYVFKKSDLYGYVVAKARELEEKCADYPRVVVGPCAIDNLKQHARLRGDSMNTRLANTCFKFLKMDQDGMWIVNYLGPEARKAAANLGPGFAKLALAGREFVQAEQRKYRLKVSQEPSNAESQKLARRYAILRTYYEDCLGK